MFTSLNIHSLYYLQFPFLHVIILGGILKFALQNYFGQMLNLAFPRSVTQYNLADEINM